MRAYFKTLLFQPLWISHPANNYEFLFPQKKFAEASEAREDSDRGRKVLESRCALDAVSSCRLD